MVCMKLMFIISFILSLPSVGFTKRDLSLFSCPCAKFDLDKGQARLRWNLTFCCAPAKLVKCLYFPPLAFPSGFPPRGFLFHAWRKPSSSSQLFFSNRRGRSERETAYSKRRVNFTSDLFLAES